MKAVVCLKQAPSTKDTNGADSDPSGSPHRGCGASSAKAGCAYACECLWYMASVVFSSGTKLLARWLKLGLLDLLSFVSSV
eukprot:CAMPEP_0180651106 /NCGR_PEP_ID=MMETSP1037_2-20121125/52656_1 /TAXON_ID=632150 /ORGANISM="Azadinium spinosum, Strain 3D9" /LENGTH=80 /DNA_ID=CAMNT_0022676629 /DNA_START=89 /DNA_END=332 /DNA_ORIENTATION=-